MIEWLGEALGFWHWWTRETEDKKEDDESQKDGDREAQTRD